MASAPSPSRATMVILPRRRNDELAHALRVGLASQQEARAQSTGTSHRQDHCAAQARTGSHRLVASAEQRNHHSAHPRTDQHNWTSREQPNTSHKIGFGARM